MGKKTVAVIIQARVGSTRLAGKILMEIQGRPMLWHLIQRLKYARLVDKIIIATTYNPKDDAVVSFAKENFIKVVRGSENDVLARFYKAAKYAGADTIVRITSDCPLLDPKIVDEVITKYKKGGFDYVANNLLCTYPDGLDVEIFSFKALERAYKEAKSKVEREHVTPYIRNSGLFKINNFAYKGSLSSYPMRWSVDEKKDLDFVRAVYKRLYAKQKIFYTEDIMSLLKKHPEIQKINTDIIINEGYYKSLMNNSPIRPRKMSIKNSLLLKKRAEGLIPSCSQTFSKAPNQFVQGVSPVFLEKGNGSHVWDVDGNEFIDYAMALAPVMLGYNYPRVTKEVEKYLKYGTVFTLPHRLEIELASLLTEIIPCAQMVRFGKNGSDVTSAAVRIARAYTGREKIVCSGYHGWQDWYIATTTRNKGIPKAVKGLTLTFEYNDINSLKRIFQENKNQIAAVIMEPLGVIEPKDKFLEEVKEITHKNKALLIFDEVITGFRLSLGGAQEYFGVIPDLACFGKAMGNGFPISAVVGRKKFMKLFDEVFFSFTFGGEILSIAASLAVISELKDKNVIQHLWEQGRKIKDGYNVLAREYSLEKITHCIGLAPRTVIVFKNKNGEDDLYLKSLFQQECIKRGVLFTGAHNICFGHSNKDIDYTLMVYRTVLEIIKKAISEHRVRRLLRGEPVEPVFRKA